MKQRIFIPILLFIAVLGTSCVSQHSVDTNYSALHPDLVRLNLTMADYQYLGDVTIEMEYKTYFGIPKILTINGQPYDPRFYRETNICFSQKVRLGILKKALFKVTDTYPNADYLVPATSTDIVEHMMGGRIHKRTMTVKAYALNHESLESMNKQHQAELQSKEKANADLRKQVSDLQKELKSTKDALEKAELDARIAAQKNKTHR